jgi:hypothetical protein
MSSVRKYFFPIICVILSLNAWGQAARSPFTTLNIGETYNTALIQSQGMAGVGVSQPQYWFLNNQNPALLIYNRMTVFQAGMVVESRTLSNDTASSRTTDGNLNYLATAFPIKPGRWTTALGLMPYSSVNYQLIYLTTVPSTTERLLIDESGEGGLTQLYWSNGVRLHRNFSIGLKASYMFGSLLYKQKNFLVDNTSPSNYPVKISEKTFVKDVMLTGGISYTLDSIFNQKKYRFSFGAVYGMKADLNANRRYEISRVNSFDVDVDADTLSESKTTVPIPASITLGVSLSHTTKWALGTEFSYQDWSTFKSLNRGQQSAPSWRAALGVETTPNAFDESYFKRATYRLGVSYEKTPFLVDVNDDPDAESYKDVKDIGVNFGASFPAGRSSLDIAFRYGKRGDKAQTILEENYFKVYFGITFNDNSWFVKRKFD